MKILYLIEPYIDASGHYRTQEGIVRALKKLGNSVSCVTMYLEKRQGSDLFDRIVYIKARHRMRLYKKVLYLILSQIKVLYALLCFDYDIMILEPLYVYLYLFPLLLAKRIRPRPYILDIRGIPVGEFRIRDRRRFYRAIRFANRAFDGITYTSRATMDFINKEVRCTVPQTEWSAGVDPEAFYPIPQKGSDFDGLTIIYHGSFMPNRGIWELLHAMGIIRAEDVKARLLLIGQGRIWQDIADWIKDQGLEGYIRLLPFVERRHINAYINEADCGIVPLPPLLEWEISSPLKLMEYLACGKPVIVSPIHAHRYFVGNPAFVRYLKEVSPEGIATAIKGLFKDRASLKDLAPAARAFAIEHLSWDIQARKLNNFMRYII